MKLRQLALAATLTVCAALGQDPPSRVARLNWMNGNVSFQPASIDTWTAANLNYPLTTGDHIYADDGARAEMHVGPNAFRLNSRSNFGFLNLDDRTVQVRFTGGSLEVRLKHLDDADLYEIDTPQGAITLLRNGDYRIDTDPDRNATMVTVKGGEAEVTANGTSFPVHPMQTGYFTDGSLPDVREANPPDDFDRFTNDRNTREDRIPPPMHVPVNMVGYEDLDAYGVWRNDPGYGWVWAPRVDVGWVPYHAGHWAWVEPWGWTWIDASPWGFAPFHYGRWASIGGAWAWAPGAVVARPVYAPALVAFVGGPHFSLSIGIGGGAGPIGAVAWFPLGPREVYYPAYHVSNTYVQQVNITHVTNVNVINVNNNVTNVRYVNQQVPGAVTAVPQNAFVSSRNVAQAAQPVSQQQLAQAQVVGTAPNVAPQRQSVLGNSRGNAPVAQPSQAMMNRQVVARTPPPPAPVSFQAKQGALAASQGRPLAPDQVAQIRQQQPAAVVTRPQVQVSNGPAAVRGDFGSRPASAIGTPRVNRMDSLPPSARPAVPPQNQPAPQFSRPAPVSRPAPEMRPAQEVRPVPVPRPMPEGHPAPEARPRPERAERPAAKQEQKAEKKEEKK